MQSHWELKEYDIYNIMAMDVLIETQVSLNSIQLKLWPENALYRYV